MAAAERRQQRGEGPAADSEESDAEDNQDEIEGKSGEALDMEGPAPRTKKDGGRYIRHGRVQGDGADPGQGVSAVNVALGRARDQGDGADRGRGTSTVNAALGRVNDQGDGADQDPRASAVNAALGWTGGGDGAAGYPRAGDGAHAALQGM